MQDRHTEPGLLRRLPGITAPSAPPELHSSITRGILERLLTSELPLALDRSAADLLRETVDVVLHGALVRDSGTSGPGDRSSAPGSSKTPRRKA